MHVHFLERITPGLRALLATLLGQASTLLLQRTPLAGFGAAVANGLLALLLYRLIDRRAFDDFGFGLSRRALQVMGWGLLLISLLGAGFWALGQTLGPIRLEPLMLPVPVIILAPVGQEFLFRGYVFRTMDRYGFLTACALSALFGALVQMLPPGEPLLLTRVGDSLMTGAVFAYIFYRTGSIWPAVLLSTATSAVSALLLPFPGPPLLLYISFRILTLLGLFRLTWIFVNRWERYSENT